MTHNRLTQLMAFAGSLFLTVLLVQEATAFGRGGGGFSRGGMAAGGSFGHARGGFGGGGFGSGGLSNRRDNMNDVRDNRQDFRSDRRDDRRDARDDHHDRVRDRRVDRRDYVDDRHDDRRDWVEDRHRFRVGRHLTAAVFRDLSCDPTTVVVDGATYTRCGDGWYQRAYSGGEVTYVVVEAPAGY